MNLRLAPISIKAAKAFVVRFHRHNNAPLSGLFAASVIDEAGEIQGVAIAGRPCSRKIQDGWTCEVTRLCTNGAKDACSMLYGSIRRAAKALGYNRIVTYTRGSEPGTSLRASGWKETAKSNPGEWSSPSRPRIEMDLLGDTRVIEDLVRWEITL